MLFRQTSRLKISFVFAVFALMVSVGPGQLMAQHFQSGFDPENPQLRYSMFSLGETANEAQQDTVPHPRTVMYRSMMIPGWGQITNNQIWKVPIVYALIGGLTYYSIYANSRYQGYRAAFYNSFEANDDFRFGQTPDWIDPNAPQNLLRSNRDFYRNRRDFLFVTVFLAYVLNVVDAYVYAHMRDFDVSDDLSARINIGPDVLLADRSRLGVSMRIRF